MILSPKMRTRTTTTMLKDSRQDCGGTTFAGVILDWSLTFNRIEKDVVGWEAGMAAEADEMVG